MAGRRERKVEHSTPSESNTPFLQFPPPGVSTFVLRAQSDRDTHTHTHAD